MRTKMMTVYDLQSHNDKLAKTIDVYDLLTGDELEEVTNILLEALAREKGLTADVFEIETNVISDHFINTKDYE